MIITKFPAFGKCRYSNMSNDFFVVEFTNKDKDEIESFYDVLYQGKIVYDDRNINNRVGTVKGGWDITQFEECDNLYYPIISKVTDIVKIISPSEEIIRIDANGRIFWKSREVETDDDFRAAMIELTNHFKKNGFN
jgi:hypothetical protein